MVLTVGGDGAHRPIPRSGEHGSYSLELALALPMVVAALALLLHAGVLAGDLIAAQAVAHQAARVAAVDDDAAVDAAVDDAAGARPVDVVLDPAWPGRSAGQQVTATVRLRSRAFEAFGATVWLPARATFRVERP